VISFREREGGGKYELGPTGSVPALEPVAVMYARHSFFSKPPPLIPINSCNNNNNEGAY
jgi:hypothetical protein